MRLKNESARVVDQEKEGVREKRSGRLEVRSAVGSGGAVGGRWEVMVLVGVCLLVWLATTT